MKFPFSKKNSLITLLVCCLFSCSSDLDFEQANDFNIQPVATTNLAYINAKASNFISNGTESPFLSYTSNVDFLNTSFVEDNLIKTELYFRIKNTIDKSFIFNVAFIDKNGSAVYNIKMNVPAYNGTEVLVEKTETFTAATIAILKSTNQMNFSILMLNGTPITDTTLGRVELSSSITAYFDIK